MTTKIDILSLFPEMFVGFKETSIIARAIDRGVVCINVHNFREFAHDRHKTVDDTPYGGGAGMVLKCQPLLDCLKSVATDESLVILMSPQGRKHDQSYARELAANYRHIIIICGHYEGFDERIRDYVDVELSIGDYVLTGGELGAMVVCDSIIRLLDGAIREASHEDDSFSGDLLEYPQYTRPYDYDGKTVPDVLLSGHHENIRKWHLQQQLLRTKERRPDLFAKHVLTDEDKELLAEAEKKD